MKLPEKQRNAVRQGKTQQSIQVCGGLTLSSTFTQAYGIKSRLVLTLSNHSRNLPANPSLPQASMRLAFASPSNPNLEPTCALTFATAATSNWLRNGSVLDAPATWLRTDPASYPTDR